MELVKEINYKKRDWRRDLGIHAITIGIVVVSIDIWTQEWLAARWFHILIAGAIAFTLHELAHGLFFKLWAGEVKFGAGLTKFGPVFYASSPGSLLSRNKLLLVALAPQALTVLYLVLGLLPFVEAVRIVLVIAAILNLGGGASDFYCVMQMLKYPKELQVEDYPTGLKLYLPKEEVTNESVKSLA